METISRSEGNRNKRFEEGKNSGGKPTHLQQVTASSLPFAVQRPPFPRSLVDPKSSSPAAAATSVKGEISDATSGRWSEALSSPPPMKLQTGREEQGISILGRRPYEMTSFPFLKINKKGNDVVFGI